MQIFLHQSKREDLIRYMIYWGLVFPFCLCLTLFSATYQKEILIRIIYGLFLFFGCPINLFHVWRFCTVCSIVSFFSVNSYRSKKKIKQTLSIGQIEVQALTKKSSRNTKFPSLNPHLFVQFQRMKQDIADFKDF